jgi:sulfur-oxidizing protein SoxY
MTADDYVESVLILADGNPSPAVATFHFTALSGAADAKTRIRLAKTQNVIAVAKMSNGSTFMDKKEVKVTIGGCGG